MLLLLLGTRRMAGCGSGLLANFQGLQGKLTEEAGMNFMHYRFIPPRLLKLSSRKEQAEEYLKSP